MMSLECQADSAFHNQDSQGAWDGLFTLQFICEERWQSDTLTIEENNTAKREISARSKMMDLEWAIIF